MDLLGRLRRRAADRVHGVLDLQREAVLAAPPDVVWPFLRPPVGERRALDGRTVEACAVGETVYLHRTRDGGPVQVGTVVEEVHGRRLVVRDGGVLTGRHALVQTFLLEPSDAGCLLAVGLRLERHPSWSRAEWEGVGLQAGQALDALVRGLATLGPPPVEGSPRAEDR